MDFLRKGLEDVARKRPQLDSFNKFGVNLFLAGACESIGLAGRLNTAEISQILNDGVQILGTKPDQAQRFADSYDSYLVDPKYLGMIEAGRTAMQKQIAKQPNAPAELSNALDTWNRPKSDETKSTGTIAVMFTDIVGSTQMTQTHGDQAAQEVVRTHNRIVRAALTMLDGREVKHTGDGIMASFNNTANAVEAGMYIQKQIGVANAADPDLPLAVKIGINAGEPIIEDNDLFGTTVQLSARIVDKASAGQVLVSDTVKLICQGKSIHFANRGAREMKGFADPITLFEAIWKDGGG
jgi:adenylate cyclase